MINASVMMMILTRLTAKFLMNRGPSPKTEVKTNLILWLPARTCQRNHFTAAPLLDVEKYAGDWLKVRTNSSKDAQITRTSQSGRGPCPRFNLA